MIRSATFKQTELNQQTEKNGTITSEIIGDGVWLELACSFLLLICWLPPAAFAFLVYKTEMLN